MSATIVLMPFRDKSRVFRLGSVELWHGWRKFAAKVVMCKPFTISVCTVSGMSNGKMSSVGLEQFTDTTILLSWVQLHPLGLTHGATVIAELSKMHKTPHTNVSFSKNLHLFIFVVVKSGQLALHCLRFESLTVVVERWNCHKHEPNFLPALFQVSTAGTKCAFELWLAKNNFYVVCNFVKKKLHWSAVFVMNLFVLIFSRK